jgi:hypothetical protein
MSPGEARIPPGARRRLAALALGLLGALLLAEGLASWRTDPWLESLTAWMTVDVPLHRLSAEPGLIYELRPSLRGRTDEGRQVTTNRLGFRDEERSLEKAPGTYRILALGGSNTYGARVDDHQTWPRLLQAELHAHTARPVEVWNLGVSGYETRQKVALARREIARARPDALLVQIYNTGPRYLLRGESPVAALERDEGLFDDWGVPRPRNAVGRWLWFRFAIARLPALLRGRLGRSPGLADPVGRGWARGMADLADLLGEHPELAARGVILPAGLVLPDPGGAPGAALEALRGTGLPLIDLRAAPAPPLPDWLDVHPGPAVYARYAQVLAGELTDPACADGLCLPGLAP